MLRMKFLLVLVAVVAAKTAYVGQKRNAVKVGDLDWWKHAVFYQIYPRSFKVKKKTKNQNVNY